jgi:hypothetical protein
LGTPFFGTQLVLLSRQLSVVSESVDEVRFAMDSVFIGPAERQTLLLNFGPNLSSLFIEELLSWVQSFSTEEGPMLIEKAGKLGVGFGFIDSVNTLTGFVAAAVNLQRNLNPLPPGFYTARVQRSWRDLLAQLQELSSLATPVGRTV